MYTHMTSNTPRLVSSASLRGTRKHERNLTHTHVQDDRIEVCDEMPGVSRHTHSSHTHTAVCSKCSVSI